MAGFWKYKPNQGYWSRTLSLIGAMMLVVAGAGWLWNELENTDLSWPTPMTAEVQMPETPPGRDVTYGLGFAALADVPDPDTANAFAGIRVQEIRSNSPIAISPLTTNDVVTSINGQPVTTTADAREILDALSAGSAVQLGFERRTDYTIYVQAGVALLVVLGFGAWLWYLLNKPSNVEFLIATESEMKKVNWPSKQEVIGSTWLVIMGTFMLAAILFFIDLGFAFVFERIGVLQTN